MKLIKEHINEKFTEDSDPIADMNIGMMHQIKLWMKSVDEPFVNKDRALTRCAIYGKLDFVEYLLAAGANVHASNDYALRLASKYGYPEIVKLLLAAGADVHTDDDYALRWASNNGRTKVVKVLLAAGADVHTYDDSALRWASSNGHTEVVKVLKDHIAKEKKVKESLNEKFTEDDSDPIEDMNIGYGKWFKLKPGDVIIANAQQKIPDFEHGYPNDAISVIYKVKKNKNKLKIELIPFGISNITSIAVKMAITDVIDKSYTNNGWMTWVEEQTYINWRKNFNILPLEKYKKEYYLNEKFTQDSDPIVDMNIGMMHQIKLWMESMGKLIQDKDNALIYSAAYGKLDFVEYLLAAGANVHAGIDWALRWASDNGHTEVVKVLLAAGADVHASSDGALRWASDKGHTEVVKVLLAAGANVHANNDYALRYASAMGLTEVVKVLKDHIAKEKRKKVKESVNEKFTEDSDPIVDMNIGMMHQIKLWMKSINKSFENKHNALVYSARHGKLDFVKYLLAAGADVHDNTDYALRYASYYGHTEVVKVLLAAGADVHAINYSAIQLAYINGHTKVVKVLKDHIAKERKVKESLNEKFTEDSDPIEDMNIGMMHQIKLWIESIGESFEDKDNALCICAEYGKTEFVKFLLAVGANVHVYNDYALRWASREGHTEVVRVLLAAGANVHAGIDYALRWASYYRHTEVVKVLKDHIAKERKVKESLNEKFTEDSDPIYDMNIGPIDYINNLPEIILNADDEMFFWTVKLHPTKIVVCFNMPIIDEHKEIHSNQKFIKYVNNIIHKIGANKILHKPMIFEKDKFSYSMSGEILDMPNVFIPIREKYLKMIKQTKSSYRNYDNNKKIRSVTDISIRENLNEKNY